MEFEGIIPEGQYGGGTVMVWDSGKYFVYGEQPLESLRDGKLHLVLEGKKAKGEWTLVRIRGRDREKNQWLMLKTGSSAKPLSKKREDASVKTGRTMKQIAEDRDAEWESNREEINTNATSKLKTQIKAALAKKDAPENESVGQAPRLVKRRHASPAGRPTQPSSALPSAKQPFVQPCKPRLLA